MILQADKFYRKSSKPFVIIIDEWDVAFRACKEDKDGQKRYLDFLRDWLKDQEYVALAYMTGILPIKKYGQHSALNMFDEYSIITPMQLAPYTGLTEEEVNKICSDYGRDYNRIKEWYNGYDITDVIPPDPDYEIQNSTGEELKSQELLTATWDADEEKNTSVKSVMGMPVTLFELIFSVCFANMFRVHQAVTKS